MTFILMTFTRLSLRRTALLSGKFGGPNLKLLINAVRLMAALIPIYLLTNSVLTLRILSHVNNTQKAESLRNVFEV